ncbi:MAG TPA: RidA family protein [Saprospiraceae bacterium]|nr:RidA family protein [Saprospiraceae bacterium]
MKRIIILVVFTLNVSFLVAQKNEIVTIKGKLNTLGLELPEYSAPMANYVKFVQTDKLIFTSGHGSCGRDQRVDKGRLGEDLTLEDGYLAAKRVGLCLLATLDQAVDGDLTKIKRIVKVLGMVNSAPSFYDQPKVMNGFSDLMVEVFGEAGRHARSAVGVAALPSNISVEIEMVVELK